MRTGPYHLNPSNTQILMKLLLLLLLLFCYYYYFDCFLCIVVVFVVIIVIIIILLLLLLLLFVYNCFLFMIAHNCCNCHCYQDKIKAVFVKFYHFHLLQYYASLHISLLKFWRDPEMESAQVT